MILLPMTAVADLSSYRLKTFRKWRKAWGFESARSQQPTDDEIGHLLSEIRPRYPNAGARALVDHIRIDYQIKVPK